MDTEEKIEAIAKHKYKGWDRLSPEEQSDLRWSIRRAVQIIEDAGFEIMEKRHD